MIQIIREKFKLWCHLRYGNKIAQLLLLPYTAINFSHDIQTSGSSNTDQKQSLWTLLVSEYFWPNVNIKINDKRFSGLFDIGSDITIISKHLWPKSWLIQKTSYKITGVSQTKIQEIYQNIQIYPYEGPESQPDTLQPYIIDAPLNLIEEIYLCNDKLKYTFHVFLRGHCSFNKQNNY